MTRDPTAPSTFPSAVEATAPELAVPVWLLDVDGVINANRPEWGAAPRQATAYTPSGSWKLRWAPALVAQIRAWHREGRVEVRWATTWCPDAGQLEHLWGLPPLHRCLSDDEAADRQLASAAKLRAALAVVELEGRPLIWTDDDAIPTEGPELDRLRDAPQLTLLLAPQQNRGLSRQHVEDIASFLDECVE